MGIDIPGLSKEQAQALADQLTKIQLSMYNMGKIDAIKILRIIFSYYIFLMKLYQIIQR